jgi:diguanylate cyclase (GGDEF)-like protein
MSQTVAPARPSRRRVRLLAAWVAGVIAIAIIGWVDFASGTELRIFPLYYLPISLLAWHAGRAGAVVGAALSALAWEESNILAGLQFSYEGVWVANTLFLGLSFATVGYLIASLRAGMMRERELSRTDPLTGLLNRRAFYEEAGLVLALCRRKERPVTLAYIDLDDFKVVNDTLGHQAGDDLIRRVAGLMRASTRPSDLCARFGGDEFAVLLPDADSREAEVALERVRSLLSETTAGDRRPVTGSIGAVTFITVPENLERMLSRADLTMYAAKAEGKNRLHLEVQGGAVG